jgi:hypothetical protein
MFCNAAGTFFFACRLEIETLGLIGFLNSGAQSSMLGQGDGATIGKRRGKQHSGDQSPFDSPAQE